MIIGNGLVAKSFKKKSNFFKNVIIFASGLADSKNKNSNQFQREEKLLKKYLKIKKKKLIYFSTLDVLRSKKTPYIRHKINIEKILINEKNTLIVRLPQLIGNSNNKKTLFNFLVSNLRTNNKIKIFINYYRNFIDVSDLVLLIKNLNKKKINFKILNIYNKKSIKVKYLLNFFKKNKIINNKIYRLDKTKDNFFQKTLKFCKNEHIMINKKNYYKKLFKKYIK